MPNPALKLHCNQYPGLQSVPVTWALMTLTGKASAVVPGAGGWGVAPNLCSSCLVFSSSPRPTSEITFVVMQRLRMEKAKFTSLSPVNQHPAEEKRRERKTALCP